VIVSVPKRLSRRVGLDFGDLHTASRIGDANRRVTFQPCEGRSPTGWPGGLILADRRPIRLRVQIEGENRMRTLRVG